MSSSSSTSPSADTQQQPTREESYNSIDVQDSGESKYDDPVPDQIVHVAQQAADAARAVLRQWFRSPDLVVQDKTDHSPVTIADKHAEQAMRAVITDAFPTHVIVGEEEGGPLGAAEDAEYAWVLDPIDGTKAFMTGKPTFGTLVAVLRRGTPVFGIIDQPIADERWMGGVGWPTTFNGAPARVRSTYPQIDITSPGAGDELLAQCIVHATHPDMFVGLNAVQFRHLTAKVKQVMYGSDCYAYALLASGYADIVVEADLKLWDFAALAPVVRAAGGEITDWQGNELDIYSDGRVVATPSEVMQYIVLNSLHEKGKNGNVHASFAGQQAEPALPEDPGPGHVESMTGFGAGEVLFENFRVVVQLRSINSRYCDIQFRGPRFLAPYESELVSSVKRALNRGRVVFTVTINDLSSDSDNGFALNEDENDITSNERVNEVDLSACPPANGARLLPKIALTVDEDAVLAARSLLDRVALVAGVESAPTLADILNFSEVLVKKESLDGMERIVPAVKEALSTAILNLTSARRREGAILELDMLTRCSEIRRVLLEIERRAPDRIAREQQRMRTRLDDLVRGPSNANVEFRGIEQEIALFADRVDITEEIVRLRAHVQMFEMAFVFVGEPIGQRLLFLLQEMHREASTISSKANDAPIAHLSVHVKQEIEKLREQVQNLC